MIAYLFILITLLVYYRYYKVNMFQQKILNIKHKYISSKIKDKGFNDKSSKIMHKMGDVFSENSLFKKLDIENHFTEDEIDEMYYYEYTESEFKRRKLQRNRKQKLERILDGE